MTFKPGQSGNPAGRKAEPSKHIREMARSKTDEVVKALLEALQTPGERVPAARVLLAYGYGNPATTINVRRIGDWSDLNDEELAVLAQSAVKKTDEEKGTRH